MGCDYFVPDVPDVPEIFWKGHIPRERYLIGLKAKVELGIFLGGNKAKSKVFVIKLKIFGCFL